MPVLAYPDNKRAAPSGDYNLIRDIPVYHSHSEGPFHLGHGLPDSFTEVAVEIHGNQLGQDLCVCLGPEYNPVHLYSSLEGKIILDNPIVDHKYLFVLIPVGMGIFLCRFTMGCPPSMCNADSPFDVQTTYFSLQFNDFPDCPVKFDMRPFPYSQTRRVVTAIFKLFQSI